MNDVLETTRERVENERLSLSHASSQAQLHSQTHATHATYLQVFMQLEIDGVWGAVISRSPSVVSGQKKKKEKRTHSFPFRPSSLEKKSRPEKRER